MNFISCSQVKQKVKVKMIGKTANLLTITVAVCRFVAERISEEKGVELNESIEFVAECIKEGHSTLK